MTDKSDWSEDDKQAASFDTPAWESNDSELSEADRKSLSDQLNSTGETHELIGTPDTQSFAPDI